MLRRCASACLLASVAGLGGSGFAQATPDTSATAAASGSAWDAGPLPILWEAGIGRGATAPALAAPGRLYVATARQDVKAFDVVRRRELWSRNLARGFQSTPRLAGGVLLVAAPHPEAEAFGLDPDTGETLWQRKAGDLAQAPLVGDDRAIFISMGGFVRAFAAASGDSLWVTRVEGVFPGGALLGDRELVVLSAAGVLYRIDPATGRRLGSHALEGPAPAGLAPLPDGEGFLAVRFDGRALRLGFDLAPLGSALSLAPMLHPPAVSGGNVLVAGADRRVRAYSLPAGELLWETPLPVPAAAPPAASQDGARVAIGDLEGVAWTLDAASGRILSRTPTSGGPLIPAWNGSQLAVVTGKGRLIVLEAAGGPTALSPATPAGEGSPTPPQ